MRRLPAAALPLAFLALPGLRVSFASLVFVNYVRAPLLLARERERVSSFVSSLLAPTECVPRSVRIMPAERMRIGDRTLPVRRFKERIIDKIKFNRVTLICGFTGSGKSSQVPQMLLEEGLAPVLCTQPRRLAVVAVAKRVAKERGCVLGQEVGYHIGQLNISSSKSKIVFETAGILLEELRTNGVAALARYKVVVLDEVHERSVESDLVLTCAKQLMLRNSNIRLVLMSATADFQRYKEYFSELGKEDRLETIAIPNIASSLQSCLLRTKLKYLENVVDQLGNQAEHAAVLTKMKIDPTPAECNTDIGLATFSMIRDLIVHLHENETDISKSVLVFLPTYRALEQQWSLLTATGLSFRLYALHSSIDMEHSLKAMEVACNFNRKVILATNVAESSVTIPGVSFVIDSCRSVEIYWDTVKQLHCSRLVWISQSQAEQRKGRTGLTCDGTVYRLVTRDVFHTFEKFETPQMQLLSLRKQVLIIASAESKAMNDPISLFQKCMNPPALTTVINALEVLEKLQAVVVLSDQKVRDAYQPTMYGRLLVSLPVSLESAIFVIHGANSGYFRESVVLGAIMDTTPFPILQPFGQQVQYRLNLHYYQEEGEMGTGGSPMHTSVLLANLHAYEFWQRTFKDKHRLDNLENLVQKSRHKNQASSKIEWGALEVDEVERNWCLHHSLSLSALHAVAETADVIMEIMHRFRPEFMDLVSGPPAYYVTEGNSHSCMVQSKLQGPRVSYLSVDGSNFTKDEECQTCGVLPFVQSGVFRRTEDEKKLMTLAKKVSWRDVQPTKLLEQEDLTLSKRPQCKFYILGTCTRGTSCPFSHSSSARREHCRYFMSPSGCRYGNSCAYLHEVIQGADFLSDNCPVEFEEVIPSTQALIDLIPSNTAYCNGFLYKERFQILLLGEGDFSFAQSLADHVEPTRIIATSLDKKENALLKMPSLQRRLHQLLDVGVHVKWGIDATNLLGQGSAGDLDGGNKKNVQCAVPWDCVGSIMWNFPFLGIDEDLEVHRQLMLDFFASAAVTLFTRKREGIRVFLTLCNNQYCRWQVERAAREWFFFLDCSIPFDTHTFGSYRPIRNNLESHFPAEKAVVYVFGLYPVCEVSLNTRLENMLAVAT